MAAFFHCVNIDGVEVALQVDSSDPVTPISEADFVTGDITDPLLGHQTVFLFQYNGDPSNGSTDGDMVGVDDDNISRKAEILMNADGVLPIDDLVGAKVTTTTDATPVIIDELKIQESRAVTLSIKIMMVRNDGSNESVSWWSYYYSYMRLTGGSLAEIGSPILLGKDTAGGGDAELIVSGEYIQVQVTGESSPAVMKWTITEFSLTEMEVT